MGTDDWLERPVDPSRDICIPQPNLQRPLQILLICCLMRQWRLMAGMDAPGTGYWPSCAPLAAAAANFAGSLSKFPLQPAEQK